MNIFCKNINKSRYKYTVKNYAQKTWLHYLMDIMIMFLWSHVKNNALEINVLILVNL